MYTHLCCRCSLQDAFNDNYIESDSSDEDAESSESEDDNDSEDDSDSEDESDSDEEKDVHIKPHKLPMADPRWFPEHYRDQEDTVAVALGQALQVNTTLKRLM